MKHDIEKVARDSTAEAAANAAGDGVAAAAAAASAQKHIIRLLSDNNDARISNLWDNGIAGNAADNLNALNARIAAHAGQEAVIRLSHQSVALAAANAILSVGPAGLNAAQAANAHVRLQHILLLADHLDALADDEETRNGGLFNDHRNATAMSTDLREKARQLRML